jgi:hypothetical protein
MRVQTVPDGVAYVSRVEGGWGCCGAPGFPAPTLATAKLQNLSAHPTAALVLVPPPPGHLLRRQLKTAALRLCGERNRRLQRHDSRVANPVPDLGKECVELAALLSA